MITVHNCVSYQDQIRKISPVRGQSEHKIYLDEGKSEGHEDYLESDLDLVPGTQSGISPSPGSSCKVYFEQWSSISIWLFV